MRVSDERLERMLAKMPQEGVCLELLDALRWQACLDLRDERAESAKLRVALASCEADYAEAVRVLRGMCFERNGGLKVSACGRWKPAEIVLDTPHARRVLEGK